ncbi:hypothetical protein WJX75_006624 [Coccomyxa subellipsoidea]|uniref:Prolyl 4-hydroxylase alpha subunit Fe(2+) 2OG dioxygenase domain-containing protein n=1 Tax=Coccomyxa subellipsoidea TaxID=248742 RepID=A0ABR2YRK5_9CHLO
MRQLLDPDANAWKLSLNYWRPKEQHQGKEADGDASTGKLGFDGAHLDHLVVENGIHTCRITGIQTNVLYVRIPKGMQGGGIAFFRVLAGNDIETPANHMMSLSPVENTLFTFRADIPHAVRDFTAQDISPRISLVLVQYKCVTKCTLSSSLLGVYY